MEAGEVTGMYPMLSVEEALARVLSAISPLPEERIPIPEALGRVTSRDVKAAYDIPPHANSAMDGYAVRAADTAWASPSAVNLARGMGGGPTPNRCTRWAQKV